MLLCLGEPLVRFLFLFLCLYLPMFLILLLYLHLIFRLLYHVTSTPTWLLRPVKVSISSELYPDYFWLPLLFNLPQVLRFWVGIFLSQPFFTFCSFLTFLAQHAFIKASLAAGSYSLKFTGLHTDPRNTDQVHLFVWFTVIHNRLYIFNLYLYMSILQKFLLVVKILIKNIDQQPEHKCSSNCSFKKCISKHLPLNFCKIVISLTGKTKITFSKI